MAKWLTAVGIVLCAAALAACGSSGKPSAGATRTDLPLTFARCMRAHGASDFPDPSPGQGFKITAQGDAGSPAFQRAQRACRRYLPSFPAPGTMSASARQHAFAFARCARAHGQPDFPDPAIGAATPATTGRVLALRGMFFAVGPNFDPSAPAFRQAAGVCGLRLPPA